MRFDTLGRHPAAILLSVLWILHLFSSQSYANLFPRDGILDNVPPSCTQACQVIATSLDTCDYGTCLCTEDGGRGLENCMNCLYGIAPSQDIYNAAQGTLSGFEDTCSPMLNISLNIAAIVSSTAASTTSVLSTSTFVSTPISTSIASTSPTSVSSNSSSATTFTSPRTTTTSPLITGEYYGKQKCVIVPNKHAPSRKRSTSSAKANLGSNSKRLEILLALMFMISRFI